MCYNPAIVYKDFSPHRKDNKWRFSKFHPDILDLLHNHPFVKAYIVPCGHCFECKMDYARNWSIRLMKELEYSKNAYFLTITYDDIHLPLNNSLLKKDIQLFFKTLKHHFNRGSSSEIKYYCGSEYGEKFNRIGNGANPHYHAIVYNLPDELVNDFTQFFPILKDNNDIVDYVRIKGSCGNYQYYSQLLEKLWGKGRITIDLVNYQACNYVARYIQKKQYGDDAKIYDALKLVPPFTIMSKSIGKKWFLDNYKRIYETDEIFIARKNDILRSKPPRYYDRLLESINLDLFNKVKDKRSILSKNFMFCLNDMPDDEIIAYFESKKYMATHKNAILVRK